MISNSRLKVALLPWDPSSQPHREALVQQRKDCGWHHDKIEKWKGEQEKGGKCMYWIALPPNDSQSSTLKELMGSKANITLQDTAVSINAVPREPSQEIFTPIGHISLDSYNPDAKDLDLGLPPTDTFWIKTFYVLHCLQSKGVGRAAMDEVESLAAREPLNAKCLVLDTVHRDDQLKEDFAKAFFGAVPKVTNQDWYSRRGYRLIKTVPHYYNVPDNTGKVWDPNTVFMRLDIS